MHDVLHGISTFLVVCLAINTLLYFFDLIAELEIELEIFFYFLDAVHDGGVIFDANFIGDFGGAETELFGEKEHGDLASGFDVGDTGFTEDIFGGEVVVFGDFFNDLFG